jgi:hypothetical protein
MKIHREGETIVSLRITFGDDDPLWNAYRVTCAMFDIADDGRRLPPRVHISLLGLTSAATPDDVLTYANEIAAVAGVAAALQAEMTQRYAEKFGEETPDAH